ncbi:O-antigen ligase family protein [Leptospira ognonensis]|uniref:O-antigen ligase family protein n=1 Tax=Leptospira ognonensis TaxID=2484945 RepID=A0A4V3JQV1_9LEPT|nr:O-antigen ligase family protein [Leptospira ognonensis]TGL57366.1 O-antigen ligase family protein [Leptospira ognonensis]
MKIKIFNQLDFIFFCIFLLSVPFSVTVSQGFAIFSILSYFSLRVPKFKDFPFIFWFFLAMYASLLLPLCFGYLTSDTGWMKLLTHSEFSDIWMTLLILPAQGFSRYQKMRVKQLLVVSALLFIFTGILSTLFPYRLSSFVMDGFRYLEGKRLPHQIFLWKDLDLSLFLPIGFQNTHLTYGALLILFFPSLFYKTFRLLRIRKPSSRLLKARLTYSFLSLIAIVLLLLNQSRSIWLGFLLALLFVSNFKEKLSYLRKYLFKTIMVFTFLFGLIAILYQHNWLFQRSITQLFAKQTLENQRIWIHKANLRMIEIHPLTGIGAGNYKNGFEASYVPLIKENPYLYYEIFITPKSHAHHDFLHFSILGGLISAVAFIILWIAIVDKLIRTGKDQTIYLGIYAIFIGGMFQCFVLDDETFLPLLAITSLFDFKIFTLSKKSISLVLIPLFLSISSILYFTRFHEKSMFVHRTRTSENFLDPLAQTTINGSNQNLNSLESKDYYFKLEGCLSHKTNFDQNPIRREEPLSLIIEIPKQRTDAEHPIRYEIEVRFRDAFDQDKAFKAHSEHVLKKFTGTFVSGKNQITIPLLNLKKNDELHFYDFGIRYIYQSSKNIKILPILRLKENCESQSILP